MSKTTTPDPERFWTYGQPPAVGTELGTYGPDPRPTDERAPRPTMGPWWALLLLAAWLAVAVVVLVLLGPLTLDDRDPRTLPPCGYEDGTGGPVPCFWDASERGNGRGTDVTVWEVP